ncbi:MAG: hypothetical protein KAS32_11860, partial [Candidatus Peribacteraceae bacterium]|nr:hypothetical protein [Candidatus Peribacteraceae bacterium]
SLCKMTKPNIGIITAIGSQHIALFGSQEALCKAKGELVEAIPNEGKVYLNTDSAPCISLIEKAKCPVIKIGTGGHADLEAYDIEETSNGIKFRIGEKTYNVPLHGTHNVTNVLLSIAVAKDIGIEEEEIIQKLKSFSPPTQTFSVTNENGIKVLNDTHNASISSFRAAIAWAKTQPIENKILLTSGLMELGELQDNIHTEMGTLSKNVFKRVIFLHKRNAESFQKGFNIPVESYSSDSIPLDSQSLLVCIGKVPNSAINHLLSK